MNFKNFKNTALVLCISASVMATEPFQKHYDLSSWFWVTAGRFESVENLKGTVTDEFDETFWEDIHLGLKLSLYPSPSSKLTLHAGALYQQAPTISYFSNVKVGKSLTTYLIEASIRRTFGDTAYIPAYLDFGYFPVYYNHNARNLGEYLFRSGVYVPYIVSGFELVDKAKVLGFRFGIEPLDGLKLEALLTSEISMFPFHDLSLTGIAKYSPSPAFEIGAGIMASRLISFDEKNTTPGKDTKKYDLSVVRKFHLVAVYDSITGDTTLLTHAGTKGAFHFSIHPRSLFETSLLGPNDLKLYGEIALLGFKDYATWYDKKIERIPVMAGINLPTNPLLCGATMTALGVIADVNTISKEKIQFPHPDQTFKSGAWLLLGAASYALNHFFEIDTWLDVLAFEVEYYKSPYYNSAQQILDNRAPAPYTIDKIPYPEFFKPVHEDDWKWSLYASKKIGTTVITGQIANDNLNRAPYGGILDFPMQTRPENYYWMIRAKFVY